MMATKSFFTIVFLLSSLAQAKVFRNAYISFEISDHWDCMLENTEWVCSSRYKEEAREAIIILTAKEAGPQDSLAAYDTHLKSPRNYPAPPSNKMITSQVIHVQQRQYQDHLWIDGMHLSSEIPNYYTRYLATVKEGLGILVTFSAYKTQYTKYVTDFNKAIQSLRVVATKGLTNQNPSVVPLRPKNETIGPGLGFNLPSDMMNEELANENSVGSKKETLIGLILLVVGIGGIIFLRMNRKPRKKRR